MYKFDLENINLHTYLHVKKNQGLLNCTYTNIYNCILFISSLFFHCDLIVSWILHYRVTSNEVSVSFSCFVTCILYWVETVNNTKFARYIRRHCYLRVGSEGPGGELSVTTLAAICLANKYYIKYVEHDQGGSWYWLVLGWTIEIVKMMHISIVCHGWYGANIGDLSLKPGGGGGGSGVEPPDLGV